MVSKTTLAFEQHSFSKARIYAHLSHFNDGGDEFVDSGRLQIAVAAGDNVDAKISCIRLLLTPVQLTVQ